MTSFMDAARAATARMHGVFDATPLLLNAHLSAKYGAEIWLKREDLTPVRSYKIRGAFNAMQKCREADPAQDQFICASAGNHAQGVAYACRHFGVKGTIFMPVTTPEQKIMKTRTFGGENIEIRLVGDYFDDTLAAAKAFCSGIGGHFLAPFDDPDVIEGQASVTVEILDQLGRAPDMLILPVGGGGLSAGAVSFLREAAPGTDIRLVEPAGGASLAAALAAGAPVALSGVDNFVDGAAVAQIGALPFERLAGTAPDHVRAIPEDRLCTTLLEMLNVEGIVLEPAGALAVDALKDLREEIAGRSVVCVTSGGNFDFERLPDVKERAQRFSGVKKYMILRLPQRPGALRDFLDLLGPEDDVARFEYLKKSSRNFGSVLIGIETAAPENFTALFARLDARGFTYTDVTADQTLAEFVI
ncbi:threonine ammonia-lyase IlvA [Mangrovicoccus algicola]|uniref:L-threonine dehydratase n=1 Tax=Mangrovicoccus algicola TaxID=2771008 RepID=A0A8J6YUY4_9RHOB|nr:threonine ammonia-lyase IlvA [Mangrovicoccus algicola]MBE3638245.1 threonine ammonia-lyase IlvA [Mangrovicoccus algicola]